MRKSGNHLGFTMVELLVVVAIIGILTAVGFVQVQNYQKSALELEEDAIAKELFIAAQNHLTMVRAENYRGLDDEQFGFEGKYTEDVKDVYYFVVNNGVILDWHGSETIHFDSSTPNVLDLMLPYGSIDETIRSGGKYIIRYQKSSGRVLDVFYFTEQASNRYAYLDNLGSGDYAKLLKIRDDAGAGSSSGRMEYNGKPFGWYGNLKPDEIPEEEDVIETPLIVVENAEKLTVKVFYPLKSGASALPDNVQLKLIVTGETSGVKKAFVLNTAKGRIENYTLKEDEKDPFKSGSVKRRVVLDDITTYGMSFADLANEGGDSPTESYSKRKLIPGENLLIQAVAFNNTVITNIGYSDVEKTNSLFEKRDGNKVSINNIRHLENLDKTVSKLVVDDTDSDKISEAEQTTDLDWTVFKDATKTDGNVQIFGDVDKYPAHTGEGEQAIPAGAATTANYYKPVDLDYALTYNGNYHNMYNLEINHTAKKAAGMFGKVSATCEIMNLAIIDANVIATNGNAGALAGTLIDTKVENVIAYNSANDATTVNVSATAGDASATAGDAGGLIGTAENCTVTKSAASLIVKSSAGNAGGLIGSVTGDKADKNKITACYSGGHTKDGNYNVEKDGTTESQIVYNVTAESADKAAGGLIGVAGSSVIQHCYSTCSVKGGTAGGFVGTLEGKEAGSTIENCYTTGLVQGTSVDTKKIPDPSDPDNNSKATTIKMPKDGAFAYKIDEATVTGCKYYEIINERVESDTSTVTNKSSTISVIKQTTMTTKDTFVYLTPLGQGETDSEIKALDESAASYDDFVGGQDEWKDTNAFVYDAKLGEYYNVNNTIVYNLPGIKRLIPSGSSTTINDTDFVYVHHGDWPAPEIFVVNKATTSGSSSSD